ncbi:MAG: hypothetical protein ACYSWZ_10345 [Planctomycetota bacterium]|jgi:hypothetical protein
MPLIPDHSAQRTTDSKLVTPQQRITRRRFLGATAVTASGILMPGIRRLDANQTVTPSDLASTSHFWYRLQPAGPYIDSQRDNKAFGFADTTIFLSEDNARTWPHSIAFPNAHNITFSSILKNGNIIFATRSRLYISTDNLKTYHLPAGTSTPSMAFIHGTLTALRCWCGVITAMSLAVRPRSTSTTQPTTAIL